MTVTLYTGHVGAGKTYEVVANVLLPALSAGRTVVSNIDGLDIDAILDRAERKSPGSSGSLVIVDRLAPRDPHFFPGRQTDGSYLASEWVPLGALVIVDEAPFYWGSDKSILPAHLAFFREHRHITDESGVACDLVVISQTVDAVHRALKGLVEFSIDCRQLKALGLTRKYTAVSYEGAKRAGKYVMGRETKTYDKTIFPLYSSFARGAGKVVATDNRFVIWRSKWFWLIFTLAPIAFIICMVVLWRDFGRRVSSSAPSPQPTVLAISPAGTQTGPRPSGGQAPAPSSDTGATLAHNIGAESVSPVSPWHITGVMQTSAGRFVVIRRAGYPLRFLPSYSCRFSLDVPISCEIRGELFEAEAPAAAPAGPAGGLSLFGHATPSPSAPEH